ncbi:hypothetical protein JQW89_18545 [Sulfitobacter pseudonitzschiae]|uniref:hypothetical protein n=1 Tax=Pseudosulfitobacter pseudonitzschiae TaxID=1402135 RepID=UPI001DEF158D|nr:hypothetical protein [Pseudosulfitobacter pseudonitzschiae]MBM1853638.1 hypothetical protein [Pseudosulfitobacter pseudonitzschiae]MBM1935988.1 hypothetical protein [Pseudosulfitobacter pseudonitzschiae]MBM2206734.1 hypothetical protein [Pseudosulfitobacter pseudonitzschiae]MBM2211411.1 hypothetical protein [Pseudosulfitobacter pseudonitzschiae]MBM2240516.1 hypothetical protein [Pseudosulfitobacter pseudonitzschiae]
MAGDLAPCSNAHFAGRRRSGDRAVIKMARGGQMANVFCHLATMKIRGQRKVSDLVE